MMTVIHWNRINMRAKEKNLPTKNCSCLVCIPGKRLTTATYRVPCAGTTGYFLCPYESIKPVTGMLWVEEKEINVMEEKSK